MKLFFFCLRCHEIYEKIKFVKVHLVTTVEGMGKAMHDIEQIIIRELSPKFHIQFDDDACKLNGKPNNR